MIKVLFVKKNELSRFFITKIHKHNTQRNYSMRKSGNSVENLEEEEGNVKAVKNGYIKVDGKSLFGVFLFSFMGPLSWTFMF